MDLLKISELSATVEGKRVLNGINLQIKSREVHAVMGPNGSGKSSLAMTLMGYPAYKVSSKPDTKVELSGYDLLQLTVDERAKKGLFVAWQNPLAIPGLNIFTLCKVAVEAGGGTIDSVVEFRQQIESLLVKVGLTKEHLSRGVNEGFSGGERKRLELLQLLLLKPKLAILDEIDSGLDVDAMKLVGQIVSEMKAAGTSFILITHYKRLLDYVNPDKVHILKKGRIEKSGGNELVEVIEKLGYGSSDNDKND